MEIRFPNGVLVRAVGISARAENADWRQFGLYLDERWMPTWQSEIVSWPDFGTPASWSDAAEAIKRAYARAARGERVEVGCLGGIGRTGTVLACFAVLSGIAAEHAVSWVRMHYDEGAVETPQQETWVQWFAKNYDRPQDARHKY